MPVVVNVVFAVAAVVSVVAVAVAGVVDTAVVESAAGIVAAVVVIVAGLALELEALELLESVKDKIEPKYEFCLEVTVVQRLAHRVRESWEQGLT